ncbi:LEA type 2 family protein [Pyrococcus sp. ST04]|uniref:LEA type 2 family protein n=1 Tax=Pyrococcus sp. ST04 TaxID=1183377 RepID=UPI0002605FEE|nr:LEA type 2 family protein [Pyrococcus sp. ST04]AFK22741.1 hypothetical protein Py04_1167 [Pyrococcus sp. ST04]
MRRSVTILILLLISVPLFNLGYFIFRYIALGPLNDCQVKILDVYVKEMRTDSADVVLTIQIHNPTKKTVKMDGVRMDIYAGDVYIGEFSVNKTITLEAGKYITIPINFTIYYSNIPTEFVRILIENETTKVNWTIRGGLYANSIFGTLEVPFEASFR